LVNAHFSLENCDGSFCRQQEDRHPGRFTFYCWVSNSSAPFSLCFMWESHLQTSWPSVSVRAFSFPVLWLLPTVGTRCRYVAACSDEQTLSWQPCTVHVLVLPCSPCPPAQGTRGVLVGFYFSFFRVRVVWFPIDYLICVITVKTTGISSLIECKLEIYWLGWTPNDHK